MHPPIGLQLVPFADWFQVETLSGPMAASQPLQVHPTGVAANDDSNVDILMNTISIAMGGNAAYGKKAFIVFPHSVKPARNYFGASVPRVSADTEGTTNLPVSLVRRLIPPASYHHALSYPHILCSPINSAARISCGTSNGVRRIAIDAITHRQFKSYQTRSRLPIAS
ncbi:hypothetical protein BDY19DRAFT_964201 [Irpex rosettiformis]|uniref:Uncharacterized protein n=1 Tax=Irpex rosettiformis TaxID=378272 RepID=A0ACB8TV02_9APHY|nr:hypothetical protein BDY19DRAFT_964201 [Irpex rosettiformis]